MQHSRSPILDGRAFGKAGHPVSRLARSLPSSIVAIESVDTPRPVLLEQS